MAEPKLVTIVNHAGTRDPAVTGSLDWSAEIGNEPLSVPPPVSVERGGAPASSRKASSLPPPAERVTVPLLRVDERFVYVDFHGEEKRFSRSSGFEVPPGGSWGTWRLSGKDHRRLKHGGAC
jgi:hypothetical protein